MKRRMRLSVTKVYRQTTVSAIWSRFFCQVCGIETSMVSIAEAAAFLNIEGHLIDMLIASAKIHAVEMINGNLRVCQNSLFQNLSKEK